MQEKSLVLSNRKMADGLYMLELEAPQISQRSKAGQFILISLGTTYDPLLRRPMSICNAEDGKLQILYQLVGRGTQLMTDFAKGDTVDIMGPLGNGFKIEETGFNILIGGGVGTAPLVYLAKELKRRKLALKMLVGMKNTELDFVTELISCDYDLTSEQSAKSKFKLVTELLEPLLEKHEDINLYCCGPEVMYKSIQRICSNRPDIKAQVSLDRHMACGVGACMGCIVSVKKAGRKESINVRTCVEGPVFQLGEVVFDD